MKKAFVLCAVVGVAVYAATAWSASTADPTVQRLVRDVATLKSQVKKLQAQQKTTTKNLNTAGGLAATGLLATICGDELTADALQGTWQVVDQVATGLGSAARFGPQVPVTATLQGQDVCSVLSITRSQVLPPTVAQFQALLAPFHNSSSLLGKAGLSLLQHRLHLK
jgi:hypothetical protein